VKEDSDAKKKFDSKNDYRIINQFVSSFGNNSYFEYKKSSNVTRTLTKAKFIPSKERTDKA
jgi:hypothetical protein